MKKETIYIDTEDDITSIIQKVKSAKEKIVALVPPKRVGVLQSAVNLKLLQKAGASVDKRVVLITANHALGVLAASAQIPVAKNLQSRPMLMETKPVDSPEDDVINGDELPVGELQKSAPAIRPLSSSSDEEIELPQDLTEPLPADSVKPAKSPKRKGPSLPDFNPVRKKIFIGIAAAILLVIFLVWANVYAPRATVNIKAKTETVDIDLPITLKTDIATDAKQNIIQPAVQQLKKTNSVEFAATGKKEVGEKATGTMTITRTSLSPNRDISVPAGTPFSSGNLTFVSLESGTLGRPFSCDSGDMASQCSTTVRVKAAAIGEDFNLSARDYQTVSGIEASGSSMTGGSKRQITVVTENDVAEAQQKMTAEDNTAIQKELTDKFTKADSTVLPESFSATPGSPAVAPAVDTEATKGQLTIEITYTLLALRHADVDKVLDTFVSSKIKKEKTQQVYDNGRKGITYAKYNREAGTIQLVGTGHTGPKIDKEKLKPLLVGKNYEEIRQLVQGVEGVEDVDTKFSPFWVSSVSSQDKINVKFKISKNESKN